MPYQGQTRGKHSLVNCVRGNATISQLVTRNLPRQHARFLSAAPQATAHETYDQCVWAHNDGLALDPPPSKKMSSNEYRRTKL